MNFTATKILFILFAIITVLLAAHIAGYIYIIYHYQSFLFKDPIFELIRFFDMNQETNVPTFFSVLLLLSSSALLVVLYVRHRKRGEPSLMWLALAIIFIFLAFDEMTSLHETIAAQFLGEFNFTGYLHYAWVVPYSIAVLIFFLSYVRFLFRLPVKIAVLFITSGFIYISGAIGFEMIGGKAVSLTGLISNATLTYVTIEETLEMIGASLFIYSLILFLSLKDNPISVRFAK